MKKLITFLVSLVALVHGTTEMTLKVPAIAEVVEQIYRELGFTVYWGAPTLTDGEYQEVALMFTFEVYGPWIPENTLVLSYASLPDLDKEDFYESVTCAARHTNSTGYADEYYINNFYGNHTFMNDTQNVTGRSWDQLNSGSQVLQSVWKAPTNSSLNETFKAEWSEDDGSVQRCTVIRTISSNKPDSQVTTYPLQFKTGTMYEVQSGFKVWVGDELRAVGDGDAFEIEIDQGIQVRLGILALTLMGLTLG